MDTTGSVQVSLELEQTTPIQGRIRVGDRAELPFSGWLELVAALSAAVSDRTKPNEGGKGTC